MGHIARNYPEAVTDGRSVIPARVFVMSKEEAKASLKLIKGMIILNDKQVEALFDSGATHSFIVLNYMTRLKMFVCEMDVVLNVSTPTGASAKTSHVCSNVNLKFGDRVTIIDLICLPLLGIDVIVGMDWLSANGATLDCNKKTVLLPVDTTISTIPKITVRTIMVDIEMPKFLSAMEVKKSNQEGCQMFMVFCSVQGDKEQKINQIKVVKEFPVVFAEDVNGLPPERS
ncbi:uncharacterized protein LOC129296683 [Prosopis cineraria]|uniref:uncharacterized protein LOC129296683 n=1 Tax=Prosopis cineraria TaxID=364024 RepID=UPI00240EB02D|nr:uncharacterized protein LOC129296683 [Prosopis cineraria]